MIDRILKATIESREIFEKEKNIKNALAWGYDVGRLQSVSKYSSDLWEEIHVEINKYIQERY